MRVSPGDVCKQPLRHLNLQLSDTEGTRHGGFRLLDSIMQHEPTRTSSVVHLSGRGPSRTSTKKTEPQNFAESLPTEMSVRIFGELDPESLCSAACACKLWHRLIEDSEQLWRSQCLLVRAVCQREVDRDRRHGLSWKVGGRLVDGSVDGAGGSRAAVGKGRRHKMSKNRCDVGEELHSQLREERLAERKVQSREVSGGAERQEDGAAGRRDVGGDPGGGARQMMFSKERTTRLQEIRGSSLYILYFLSDKQLDVFFLTFLRKRIMWKENDSNGTETLLLDTGPLSIHRPNGSDSSRDDGRRSAARPPRHRPEDPAQRRSRVLQGGRKPLRSEPNHQTAHGLQVQDPGGAEARNRGGHQHEHRRHRLPSGAAVQGRGLGGLSRKVRHGGRPAHEERRPAACPSQHRVQQGGDIRDRLAGKVLQLLQEGALPVREQVQQHRVRMQAQRDTDPNVDQQGDVQLSPSVLSPQRTPAAGRGPALGSNLSITVKGQLWYLYCFMINGRKYL